MPPDGGRWHGPAAMVVAMGCWAGNDAFVKQSAEHLMAGPILALRGAFALAILCVLVVYGRIRAAATPESWRRHAPAELPGARSAWHLLLRPAVALRCALELGAALTAVWALALAPLATVTALAMLAPLLTTASAHLLRWESASRRNLLAVGAGLIGALLVVAPWQGPGPDQWGTAAGLACALCLSARDLSTRRLAGAIPAPVLTAATTATACATGLALWSLNGAAGGAVRTADLWMLAGAAICATAGNLLLVRALRLGTIGEVMPFRFTLLLWAALLGALVWNERPAPTGWAGLLLIALGGMGSLRHPAAPRSGR